MVQKIFRAGNNVVVSLPEDVLEQLGLEEGTEVSVKVDLGRRCIVIAPVTPTPTGIDACINEEFARQVAEFIEQYRPALEALARR